MIGTEQLKYLLLKIDFWVVVFFILESVLASSGIDKLSDSFAIDFTS